MRVEFTDETPDRADEVCRTCLDNLVPYYYADAVDPAWLTKVTYATEVEQLCDMSDLTVTVHNPDGTHHIGRVCDLCGDNWAACDMYDATITFGAYNDGNK